MDPAPSSDPATAAGDYRFGRFVLDPARRVLLDDGRPARLGQRAVDLLLVLVQQRGRVVTRNELFDRVWPGLVVEDNNLQQHISSLRKLLGPQAIVTVPGRGYQFTPVLDGPGTATTTTGSAAAAPDAERAVSAALPPDPGPLFGREADLAELGQRLLQHRLVTLVGPGGIGKTRLAWAAARAEAGRWGGGVAWVDLSPLDSGRSVVPAVAQALDIVPPEPAGGGAASALASVLRGRRLLLLLDNCEHLLDAVAALVEALHRLAPQVHVLATSQEPLRLPGEQVMRLQTLADDAAARLFVARASAADRRFTADDAAAAAAITDICRRMGGIPLAIELAAARVPLLGVAGLHRRLDEGLRVLARGPARAPARQRTLHAALAWSHALLSPAEQALLRRLAVFSGGFAPELAQRVLARFGADADADPWQLLDRLGVLVDKSLLISDTEPVPRCRLLEPVREFALERLHASLEEPALRLRHAQAMFGMLCDFDRAVTLEPNYDAALRPVLAEADNLRAAMRWLAAAAAADTPAAGVPLPPADARRLAIEVAAHADWLSVDADGDGAIYRFCELARGWLDGQTPPWLRGRMLLSFQNQARTRSLPAAVRLDDTRAAVALFRAAGDRPNLYRALCMLGRSSQKLVAHDEAGAALAEAQALEDPAWSPRLRMRLQVALEWWHDLGGRLEESLQAGRRCLALARQAGSVRSVIATLGNLADTEYALGHVDEAIALCREAIGLAQSSGLPAAARHVYSNMVPALLAREQLDDAAAAIREGRRLMVRSHGSARDLLLPAALLAWRRADPASAARLLGCAERVYRELGDEPHPPERRMRDTVLAGLQAALPAERLQSLWDEGAAFSEDEGFVHADMA